MVHSRPGVFVEEISTLPPSVAEVSTAIPAFIGYTEQGPAGDRANPVVARVSSMIEYEQRFGGPQLASCTVELDDQFKVQSVTTPPLKFMMYYMVRHYFLNGGGPCYIVSVGSYSDAKMPDKGKLEGGLTRLLQEDEPTLLLLGDAVNLTDDGYYDLCVQALEQCSNLKDRFAIFDVPEVVSPVDTFRNKIGMKYLNYGAAYYPFLETSLSYSYHDARVDITPWRKWTKEMGTNAIEVSFTAKHDSTPTVEITEDDKSTSVTFAVKEAALTITLGTKVPDPKAASDAPSAAKRPVLGKEVVDVWNADKSNHGNFNITQVGNGTGSLSMTLKTALAIVPPVTAIAPKTIGVSYSRTGPATLVVSTEGTKINFEAAADTLTIKIPVDGSGGTGKEVADAAATQIAALGGFSIVPLDTGEATLPTGSFIIAPAGSLAAIQSTNTALYNQVKSALAAQRITLPPSAAIAGIYAATDRDRGVWKAPANVSVSAVVGPAKKITDNEQEGLNVDPTSGKSINAIRSFAGKGTMVWGARTLAGNDNEWRYVPVRRLFIMIEESARKATAFAVFEPNDMTTWLKVKGMIESFLYSLWERGALAGSSPDKAYYVNVGLGRTMTQQDILEGRMNVEIGIAAVRPAEFIVLKFSHKLQEA